MSEKTHLQEFAVDGIPNVLVANIRGSVNVAPGPDGQVKIQAAERGSDDRTRVEIGQDEEGSIYARTKYEKNGSVFGSNLQKPNKVEYTITVPANTDLEVKGVSSWTDVRGITGEVRLKSVSGSVQAADLSGELHLETVSGRITAEGLSGPAELRTVSGGVRVTGSALPSLLAHSVSGSMDIETPIGDGPYEIRTVSGSAKIRSEAAPGGRIHFKSVSGSATVNGDRLRPSGDPSRSTPRNAVYELSGEGPDIHFSSVSGNLKLVSDDYVPAEAPDVSSEAPEPVQPSRMEILEKIAGGEMTVDDAVKEMGGL